MPTWRSSVGNGRNGAMSLSRGVFGELYGTTMVLTTLVVRLDYTTTQLLARMWWTYCCWVSTFHCSYPQVFCSPSGYKRGWLEKVCTYFCNFWFSICNFWKATYIVGWPVIHVQSLMCNSSTSKRSLERVIGVSNMYIWGSRFVAVLTYFCYKASVVVFIITNEKRSTTVPFKT